MNHPNPKAIVEQFMSFMERLEQHQLRGSLTELPVVGAFEIRDHKIAKWRDFFDLKAIQNGFSAASRGAS